MRTSTSIRAAATAAALIAVPVATGGALPECTINFDSGCPNAAPQCGADFDGGGGCQ